MQTVPFALDQKIKRFRVYADTSVFGGFNSKMREKQAFRLLQFKEDFDILVKLESIVIL